MCVCASTRLHTQPFYYLLVDQAGWSMQVLASANHVALYDFDQTDSRWVRTQCWYSQELPEVPNVYYCPRGPVLKLI